MHQDPLPPRATDVLNFWFSSTNLQDDPPLAWRERWFAGGPALDAELRARFGALHADAAAGRCDHWKATLAGRLALIVVLDQFSRNIHRGTPAAFAQDSAAQALALEALATGAESALGISQRCFLLMPLEHAERLEHQQMCVQGFARLLADTPTAHRERAEGFLAYAQKHHDIVARFGRFPHRNPILGRAHTPEEAAWLAGGGDTFGPTIQK